MDEQLQETLGQEQTQEQIEQPVTPQENYEPQEEEVEEAQAKPKESDSDRNFRALREKAERIEKERDEAMRKMQELYEKAMQASSPQAQAPVEEEDYDININPDDFAEGKHLTKMQKKIQKLERQLQEYNQRATESSVETRLKTQYPDFDSVVNPNNIEKLRSEYPEIAQTIHSSQDLYSKAVSAYTLIKKLGISHNPYQQDVQRAQTNAAKPRPLSSISPQQGDTPLSRANAFAQGLTDEVKTQLRKEMEDAIRNR